LRSVVAATALGAFALSLGACATNPRVASGGNYVQPIGNSQVTPNPTPYSDALVCLAEYARHYGLRAPRVSVWKVNDLTGQLDSNGGRPVTQGAQLMAITALGKAGIPLVERYETDPSKLEYALENNRLVRSNDATAPANDYEPILPGQIDGADYFLTGGVTELNNNIQSDNVSVGMTSTTHSSAYASPAIGGSRYVLNIGIDLRLVNTKTLDIVDIVSYQKQIIGRQVGIGAYAFLGNNIINASAATGAQEPTHLATRAVIERAVFEIVANLYGMRDTGACLNPAHDPLAEDDRDAPRAWTSTPPPRTHPQRF
jgi:curli production assembly/transport component CsgG/holdfast attachment protein HfaB